MSLISVVVPCYNEEQSLPFFYEEMNKTRKQMKEYDFELIFVDDGSKDKTMEKIKKFAVADSSVKYISFSRNFGKEAAIYAGLKNSAGDLVVMMDADLQDPPSLLPEMVKAIQEEGYDSVATRRITRKGEPKIRSFFARKFYKIINKISDADLVDGARDYRLMSRKFVDSVLSISEYNRFTKGIFGWVGYKTKWIEYENVERVAGETKWSFIKLFKYALDGITSFSYTPLKLSTWFGMIFMVLGFLATATLGILNLCINFSSLPLYFSTITMFFTGIILFFVGINGKYIAKINAEVKNRPIYIVQEDNIKTRES